MDASFRRTTSGSIGLCSDAVVQSSPAVSVKQLPFDDPRRGRTDSKHTSFAMMDLWRMYLRQCPECGRVHGGGDDMLLVSGNRAPARPERHIYEYTCGIPEDLICPLCGEVFQNPTLAPCGHRFCSMCVRTLLTRTLGRAACPADGQPITRFSLRSVDTSLLERINKLWVRCPVCRDPVRKGDLHLHLQDPVAMVEEAPAYDRILRPFYMSCPLSNFTVGEFNGSSSLIRFYRRLGDPTLCRFVFTTAHFLVLPDPKMGFQPHTEEDFQTIRQQGGYFNAWWVHPSFRKEVWWADGNDSIAGGECAEDGLLAGRDCSAEPWHASSFVHTWSSVQKPSQPRYICSLRDLRGEHLQMLEEFRGDALRFLQEKYGAGEDKVAIFIHYPSSARYSTLHLHIVFAGSEGARYDKYAKKEERPHQLSRQFSLNQVIDTLRSDPGYFQACTLNYYLGDKADLMDPISAYFGRSPHRYIHDFTFHWDPDSVPEQEEDDISGSGGGTDVASLAGAGDDHVLAAATMRRRSSSLMDDVGLHAVSKDMQSVRAELDQVRKSLDELTAVVRTCARDRLLEDGGAYKLLATLSSLGTDGPRRRDNADERALVHTLAAGVAIGAVLTLVAVTFGGRLSQRA